MELKSLLEVALRAHTGIRVIGIDPGETTGVCCFDDHKLVDARQLPTGLMPMAARTVREYIKEYSSLSNTQRTVHIVMESYRVYSWKADEHAWAGLHTPRLIGAIELVCSDLGLSLKTQSAQQGKGFCTDDKLMAWGIYQEGARHARDAIRHACYYLLFEIAKIHQPGERK